MFLCCLHLEIYIVKTYLYPVLWWCVRGRGRNQGVARLVLNGLGIAVPEIFETFARIRDDAFTFVSLRTKSYLIAPYR